MIKITVYKNKTLIKNGKNFKKKHKGIHNTVCNNLNSVQRSKIIHKHDLFYKKVSSIEYFIQIQQKSSNACLKKSI